MCGQLTGLARLRLASCFVDGARTGSLSWSDGGVPVEWNRRWPKACGAVTVQARAIGGEGRLQGLDRLFLR
jgi:hypothetical protein